MVGCSIRNCQSRSEKGSKIKFYSFPKNESVANEWIRYCGLKTTCKNGRVCSKHFTSSDYNKPTLQHILMKESPRKIRILKPDAIPTLQIVSVEKSNSTDLTAKSTVCTGGQTDNCEKKENYNISAPSCCNNLKAAVHNTTPANNVEGSSNVVEESDKKITVSEAEYKLLKRKVDEYEVLKINLKQIFTPGLIRCLTKPDRNRVRWSVEDIAAAKSLRSISPKGYRHLRTTAGIPLPDFSTLNKRASKFDIYAGAKEEAKIQENNSKFDVEAGAKEEAKIPENNSNFDIEAGSALFLCSTEYNNGELAPELQ